MMPPPPAKPKKQVQEAGAAKVAASGPGAMAPPPAKPSGSMAPPPAKASGAMAPPPAKPSGAMAPPKPRAAAPPPSRPAAQPPPKVNYTPPEWSAAPTHPFRLEVIKNGAVVESVDVANKAFVLIGRQEDVCDIAMQHPSISRQHAVIQHRDSGEIFVYEMGSTHGTLLNKRRLPAKEHVEMSVGDVLRFGASSRVYCLLGPDNLRKEVLRDNHTPAELQKLKYDLLQKKKQQMQERRKQEAAAAAEQLSDATCMWGDQEDAEDEDLEGLSGVGGAGGAGGAAAGSLSSFGNAQRVQSTWEMEKQMREDDKAKEGMSEREKTLLEKINQKQSKLNNMTIENERISAKEIEGDLSEGQRGQLARNEQNAAKVNDELQDLLEQMDELKRTQARQRGEAPPPSRSRRRKAGMGDDSDEDDEFFDRAAAKKKKAARGKGGKKPRGQQGNGKGKASLPELRARKAEIEASRSVLQAELKKATVEEQEGGGASSSGKLDPLDAFMADNKAAGKTERKQEVAAKLAALATELEEIEQTLGFAQPAYLSLQPAALEASNEEATVAPAVSSAAAALGAELVASAREHTEKPAAAKTMTVAREPVPGSMAAAIAQAKASAHDEADAEERADEASVAVKFAPRRAAGATAPQPRGPLTATTTASGRGSGAAEREKPQIRGVEGDRVSVKELLAKRAQQQEDSSGPHTSAGEGLG